MLLPLVLLATSLEAQSWTEESITALFLNQNPLLRESRARVAQTAADYRGRTLLANPVISVSREAAGRTEFYQASQSLPLSGRRAILEQASVSATAAVEADTAGSLWNARSALRVAFYRTLAAEQRERAFATTIDEFDKFIQWLKAREREGESSSLDRLRTEQERADLVTQLAATRAAAALERGELLTWLPTGTALGPLSGTLLPTAKPMELPALRELALTTRQEVAAERKRLEQFRLEERAAQRLRIPEPSVIAGLKRAELNAPVIANGPVVGVSLAIPLFNQGKTEVARHNAEQERIAARLEMLTRRITAQLDAAASHVALRRAALDGYADNTTQLVDIATVAYTEGEIPLLQLLDAWRLRHQSRLRRLELEAEVRLAHIHLESVLGQELTK